jgi:hypothetical protein
LNAADLGRELERFDESMRGVGVGDGNCNDLRNECGDLIQAHGQESSDIATIFIRGMP